MHNKSHKSANRNHPKPKLNVIICQTNTYFCSHFPEDHGDSRPSMDTEALSEDEVEKEDAGGFEEISFDYTTLNPSCLVPPTIPNTLGADDIDKVTRISDI